MELDALHDALEDISWTDQQDWIETQAVTAPEASTLENVDDDVQRELSFYNQVRRSHECESEQSRWRALWCTPWCTAAQLLACACSVDLVLWASLPPVALCCRAVPLTVLGWCLV